MTQGTCFFSRPGKRKQSNGSGWDGEATGKARKESSLPSAPVLQKTGAHVLKGRTMVNKPGVENVHRSPLSARQFTNTCRDRSGLAVPTAYPA